MERGVLEVGGRIFVLGMYQVFYIFTLWISHFSQYSLLGSPKLLLNYCDLIIDIVYEPSYSSEKTKSLLFVL